MTAVPRDPDFWRRFSTAVHQSDPSQPPSSQIYSSNHQHDHDHEVELEHSSSALLPPPVPGLPSRFSSTASLGKFSHHDVEKQEEETSSAGSRATRTKHVRESSWLEHERSKQRRGKWMMPLFVIAVVGVIVLIVLVMIWLSSHGWFAHGEKFSIP